MFRKYEIITIVALCDCLKYIVFVLIINALFSTLSFSF